MPGIDKETKVAASRRRQKTIRHKNNYLRCGFLKMLLQPGLIFSQVEYVDLTPALEREIFQRVQLGMALTT
jgi:hypothetical protein